MSSVAALQPPPGMEQADLADLLRDTLAALNGTLNLDEVLDLILTNVGFVVPHDAANIMLVEDGTAYVVRETGFSQRGLGDWILALRLPVAEHREPQTDVGNGAAGMHLRFASRSQLAAASSRRLAVFVCRSAASLSRTTRSDF